MSYNYTNEASSPMIKVAIFDVRHNQVKHIHTCHVPRMGETVEMGYEPMCTVTGVLWHPKVTNPQIDPLAECIVFVE